MTTAATSAPPATAAVGGGPSRRRAAMLLALRLYLRELRREPLLAAEQGSHVELLAGEGTYAQLWNRQSGGFLTV